MKEKARERLRRSMKRTRNRNTFLQVKSNRQLPLMDASIRRAFPDEEERQNYIQALIEGLS